MTPDELATLLERHRSDAEAWVQLCEGRYQRDEASVPLRMARRWHRALADPVDWDGLATLVRESELAKNQHDVAFHAWCNDIVREYHTLWQAHLDSTRPDAMSRTD